MPGFLRLWKGWKGVLGYRFTCACARLRMCAHETTLFYPSNPSIWSERTTITINKRRKSANHGVRKMEGQGADSGFHMEGHTLPDGFVNFDLVQERLVEAVLLLWRLPDRERGWHRVKAMWPDVMRLGMFDADGGNHPEADPQPRIPPATRHEMAEMEEALAWMRHVPDRDRRLVALAVRQLARGAREVRWRDLLAPMGLKRGADGLRMRYGRAINAIAVAANGNDRPVR